MKMISYFSQLKLVNNHGYGILGILSHIFTLLLFFLEYNHQ